MKKAIACVLFLGALMAGLALPVQKAGSGNWAAVKTKNDPGGRSECSMAAVNGKLYLFGGDGGEPQPVECFDPKTLTWQKRAVAPIVMHHFQVVAYGSKVYALEAFSSGGFPNQEPMANVYVYDTEKDTWEKGGEMPASRRRAGAGAALYNGKLYLVAGIQHGHSSGTTKMFDVYDPATGKWAVLPNAPHIRDHSFAVVTGDKLYTAGGRNTSFRDPANRLNFFSQVVLDVDCYDFKTGAWSTLPAKLPLGTGGGSLVALDDKLYYLGGERATATENNAPRKNTFFLNLALPGSQWQETDSLKQARNGVAAAVLNGKIYVAGGAGGSPGGPPPPAPPPGGSIQGGAAPPPSPGVPPQPGMPPPSGVKLLNNRQGASVPGGGGLIALEVFTLK